MNVLNDILIPRFKEAFTLNYFQAMLVQLAFFGAYSIGGLVYYLISMLSGDPINRIGYKKGVIIGLLISAVGSALFYPAAMMTSHLPGPVGLSVLPGRAVHCRLGPGDAADCGQSVRDHPGAGAHRLQPAESVPGVQFLRHDHRADHWRLADLHRVRPARRPRRGFGQDPLPWLRGGLYPAGGVVHLRPRAQFHQQGCDRPRPGRAEISAHGAGHDRHLHVCRRRDYHRQRHRQLPRHGAAGQSRPRKPPAAIWPFTGAG